MLSFQEHPVNLTVREKQAAILTVMNDKSQVYETVLLTLTLMVALKLIAFEAADCVHFFLQLMKAFK